MPLTGKAAVAIWNDITDENREGFFEWHPREHMNERLGIPGFLRGRRYITSNEAIEFFTLYEAEDKDVLGGESYKRRLASPTEWSLAVLPGFRNNLRGVCDVVANEGYADGGLLMTMRFRPAADLEDQLRERLAVWCAHLITLPRITGAQLLICDKSRSGTNTALQRGRTITAPDWIILIEASATDGMNAAEGSWHSAGFAASLDGEVQAGRYRLEYQVSRLTVAAELD